MARIETKTRGLLITISVLASCLVAILALWKSRAIVEKEAIQKLLYQTKYQAQTFEDDLDHLKSITQSIETAILTFYPNEGLHAHNIEDFKAQLADYMLNMGENMKPLSMWLILNPDLVSGQHTVSYFDRERNGKYIREKQYSINDYDLTSEGMKWWVSAIKEGEVWTNPYYWKNWDMELISYSKAFYIDSVFVGCVGSDFNFTKKRETWDKIQLYSSGYITLVDKEHQFILHPSFEGIPSDQVISQELYERIKDTISVKESGYVYIELEKENKILAFQKLSNNWILIAAVPVNEIYRPVYQITQSLLIILLVVIAISVVIATIFSKSITSPIKELAKLFMDAEKGNLTVRSKVKSNDELEKLGNRFNYFMSEMQGLIGQLKEQGNTLKQAKEKAEESDNLKTAFLTNLSHELRTPLNAIIGFSGLLFQDVSMEQKKQYWELIQENNNALLKFFDNILIFSQLEQNQVKCINKDYQLSEIFQKISEEINDVFAKRNPHIELSILLPEKCTIQKVSTDFSLLLKIVNELMDNAYKFTKSGKIMLEAFEKVNSWGFSVTDTGIGIPRECKGKIFGKFIKYAPDNNILYPGIGMGLTIIQNLAEILQGKIRVDSEVGKGSKFTITFAHKI